MGARKKTLAERVDGMKPSHRKGLLAALLELAVGAVALVTIGVTGFDGKLLVLGGLLLLFGVGGLTGSLSQGEAAQAQAEDRSRQAKARMYDVLTGVLFAMTLLSLVGAAITQAAGFVALLLVSASLLGVAWIGYRVPGCCAPGRKENVKTPPGRFLVRAVFLNRINSSAPAQIASAIRRPISAVPMRVPSPAKRSGVR